MISVSWGTDRGGIKDKAEVPLPREMATIIAEVAMKYGITLAQIMGNRKARKFSWPRQEAMWRCYNETGASLPKIAKALGKKEHTSVLHGCRVYEERMKFIEAQAIAAGIENAKSPLSPQSPLEPISSLSTNCARVNPSV